MVAADGGVFAFGDAGFFGSCRRITLDQPIVGIAATPDGKGYWMVAADGGVFTFGDAGFFGSLIGRRLDVAGASPSPPPWTAGATGSTAGDGGVFAFGDAGFYGSTLATDASGLRRWWPSPPPWTAGYWLVGGDGGVFTFGDAGYFGSVPAGAAAGRRAAPGDRRPDGARRPGGPDSGDRSSARRRRSSASAIVAGLAGALALARFMTALVFGIATRDPVTFAAVPAMLAAVALVAALVPARRAAAVDPMRALRED